MTISEIAKLAGVSNAAVSRYLNNGYLSAEKRAAIQKVIEETGYRPSVQAQTMRTGKTHLVGVIIPKIDSFSVSKVVAGIDSVLEKAGYQILLGDAHNNPARELEYLRVFDEQRVDGVLLLGSVFTAKHLAHLKNAQNAKIPTVVIGQQLAGVDCVYHDDYHAFYEMTTRLMDRGCRRLGFIGALQQDKAVGADRTRAFCDAVRDAGLTDQCDHTVVAGFSMAEGRSKAQELLARFGPLDAILCATDRIAIGALQALQTQGLAVPGDVLLTGQGDNTLCHVCSPTITTIRYAYEESGATAAALLLERMEKTAPAPQTKSIMLGYEIKEQASTTR